mmetsp:Transcript_43113/g.71678  ORF Transcript_43113/g.71678 Transcript_43113/m.71678 type:complete len:549 (+) Transcript_43113:34-1680(+)
MFTCGGEAITGPAVVTGGTTGPRMVKRLEDIEEPPVEGVMKTLPGGHQLMRKMIAECAIDKIEKREKKEKLDAEIAAIPYIVKAAAIGDTEGVQKLVASGADVNQTSAGGWAPVHMACRRTKSEDTSVECLAMLLKLGADIDQRMDNGCTALHYACENGRTDCTKLLIGAQAQLDLQTPEGGTALHVACQVGHPDCAQLLLSAGATADLARMGGAAALHLACNAGQVECVRVLINGGASVSLSTDGGSTPLCIACSAGRAGCARLLLDAKADANLTGAGGQTPLCAACEYGAAECLQLLIDHGATIDQKNHLEATPLFTASKQGEAMCVRVLLAAGAVADLRCSSNATPLYVACYAGSSDCVRQLIRAKADINSTTVDGFSPIYAACSCKTEGGEPGECLKQLLACGGAVNMPASSVCGGNAPLHIASRRGKDSLVRLLLEHGADPVQRSSSGALPLDLAKQASYANVVEVLTRHMSQSKPQPQKAAAECAETPYLKQRVYVVGLARRPELNNQSGVAISFDAKAGRYGVALDSGERVRVLPVNLELA